MADRNIDIQCKATIMEGGGIAVAVTIGGLPNMGVAVKLMKDLQVPIRNEVLKQFPGHQFFDRDVGGSA